MPRGRKATAVEAVTPDHVTDPNEPGTITEAIAEVLERAPQEPTFNPADFENQEPAPASPAPEGKHAQAVGRKQYTPPPNPHGIEGKYGKANRVHLMKSEPEGRDEQGAWVIRFDTPPNEMEGYSKDNPHPVIAYLKSEGYRWGFDEHDNKGGWGKYWQDDPYGVEHDQARKVLAKAAEMVGASVSQGMSIPA